MKSEFTPIDLSEENIIKLIQSCMLTNNTKTVMNISLQTKDGGFEKDGDPVKFDFDKVKEQEKEIQFLFGQLALVHLDHKILKPGLSFRKYTGEDWTKNKGLLITFLHLGIGAKAISYFVKDLGGSFVSADVVPTLSPIDPNFKIWFEKYEKTLTKKKNGQEPADN